MKGLRVGVSLEALLAGPEGVLDLFATVLSETPTLLLGGAMDGS